MRCAMHGPAGSPRSPGPASTRRKRRPQHPASSTAMRSTADKRHETTGIACWSKLEITPPSISNHPLAAGSDLDSCGGCVCRKSDSAILVMKAAEDRLGRDNAKALNHSPGMEAIGAGGQSMSVVPPIASKFCAPQRKTPSAQERTHAPQQKPLMMLRGRGCH
jgi:hypothetical protein